MGNGKNICLIGYMGSGKSTVGRLAAKRLDMRFADTDELIAGREKRSIPDIFEKDGESFFRRLETGLLKELSRDGLENTLLSTGGGIILAEENRAELKNIGTVIYLRAEADTLYERVRNDTGRPLLNTGDVRGRIAGMLKMRAPLYEAAAAHIIDTDGLSVEQTVSAVEEIFKTAV